MEIVANTKYDTARQSEISLDIMVTSYDLSVVQAGDKIENGEIIVLLLFA